MRLRRRSADNAALPGPLDPGSSDAGPSDLGEATSEPGAETRAGRRRRMVRRALLAVAVIAGIALAYGGYTAYRVYDAWRGIERVEFDLAGSREAIAAATSRPADDPGEAVLDVDVPEPTAGPSDDDVDVFLMIGSDDGPSKASVRADAVMLYVRPDGRSDPALISLPRDMVVESPCTGAVVRIATLLEGCGPAASGPELVALAVEDFTGLAVDHFAIVGFEGFVRAIDILGGIDICSEYPVRNVREVMLEGGGCTHLDGRRSLWWVQARTLEEFIDGEWRPIPGEGDRARNARQQEFLLALADQMRGFRSVNDVAHLISRLGDAVILDDSLSLTGAARLAWSARRVSSATVHRPQVPVRPGATEDGQFVWIPEAPFSELLELTYPEVF